MTDQPRAPNSGFLPYFLKSRTPALSCKTGLERPFSAMGGNPTCSKIYAPPNLPGPGDRTTPARGRWVVFRGDPEEGWEILLRFSRIRMSLLASRPESPLGSAVRTAKCFEDFQNVRWLSAGELLGEIEGRAAACIGVYLVRPTGNLSRQSFSSISSNRICCCCNPSFNSPTESAAFECWVKSSNSFRLYSVSSLPLR